MSKKITNITKRDISNLFINGLDIVYVFDTEHINYPYYGVLSEIDFLKRLYDLRNIESLDFRFENAEQDIWQHTQNNDDYELGWVFNDSRFQLKNGNDEIFLKFLCEVFHPEVRCENNNWSEVLTEINKLLANDYFELYPISKISGHDVYGWRVISKTDNVFLPFSQRNMDAISSSSVKFAIKRECRKQLLNIFRSFDEQVYLTDNTGYNYNSTIIEEVFKEISSYYDPMCYNADDKYTRADNFDNYILRTRPYYVFDVIEIYARQCNDSKYSIRIDALLKQYDIKYRLDNSKLVPITIIAISKEQIGTVPEVGVTELLQKAQTCFNNGDKQIAIEKLWDALERIKTIYEDCDKKHSLDKVLNKISKGDSQYKTLFDSEFQALTDIGNNFRIRHHETNKKEINEESYYDYFYYRCSSLIGLVLNNIK